jgi:ketosteroid isomerase-like protein
MARRSAAVLAAAIALGVLPRAPGGETHDVTQIEALEAHYAAAVNAKDLNAVMRVYVPGSSLFVFDVQPPREYVGAVAYRRNWKGFFATVKGRPKFAIDDMHVETSRNLAYSHSIQHVSGTDTRGKPFDIVARVTDVYRKVGGRWLIEHEHASVPIALMTERPDLTSKP